MVNDSGGQLQGYWLAYLGLWALMAALVVSINDYDMFLEAPIQLPVIPAKLAMEAFLGVAPLSFCSFISLSWSNMT